MSENKENDPAIQFSINLIEVLSKKVKDHNLTYPSNKTNLSQVLKVYKTGVETFSSTIEDININVWAVARVNMYLRTKRGGNLSNIQQDKASPLKPVSSLVFEESTVKTINLLIDATAKWAPNNEDVALAKQDTEENKLNFNFKSVDDIYLPLTEKHLTASIIYDK